VLWQASAAWCHFAGSITRTGTGLRSLPAKNSFSFSTKGVSLAGSFSSITARQSRSNMCCSSGVIGPLWESGQINQPTYQSSKVSQAPKYARGGPIAKLMAVGAIRSGGTANFFAGWTTSTTLRTSGIFQSPATNYVGIATTAPIAISHQSRSGSFPARPSSSEKRLPS
jgi:hypothetical protein